MVPWTFDESGLLTLFCLGTAEAIGAVSTRKPRIVPSANWSRYNVFNEMTLLCYRSGLHKWSSNAEVAINGVYTETDDYHSTSHTHFT